MEPNKDCLFFAGGKKFNIEGGVKRSNVTMEKTKEGVTFTIKLTISGESVENLIFNYDEFETLNNQPKIPGNMVFVKAYGTGEERIVPINNSQLMIGYDEDEVAEFSFNLKVDRAGKIDHSGLEG